MSLAGRAGFCAPPGAAAAPLRIERVTVVIDDIYTEEEVAGANGLVRVVRGSLNALHVNTQERIIRRELLFAPGDSVEAGRLAETERNLRGLGYLTEVSVAVADTLAGGGVEVLVHARETWSLQTQFAYARSSNGDQRWNIALEDENFLGYGTLLSVGVGRDEDRRFSTLGWRSRRLFGSRWRVGAVAAHLSDGHATSLAIERPFYELADTWALEARGVDQSSSPRFFLSHAGPAGADPGATASLWAAIPYAESRLDLALLRRVGGARSGRVWRLGTGFLADDIDYVATGPGLALSDGRTVDDGFLFAPDTPLRVDAEPRLGPLAVVQSVGRNWAKSRYLLKYGAVEDVPLDLSCRVQAAWAGRLFGSARDGVLLEWTVSDWSRAAGGFVTTQVEGRARFGSAANRMSRIDAVAGWFGRGPAGLTRISAEAAWGDRICGREAFTLGLPRGLRTLAYDGMAGDRLVRWNFEQGWPLPFEPLGFYHVGLAAFYDGGAAWWRGEPRGPGGARHEVGVGLRLGATRAARAEVVRLDASWALDAGGGPVFTAVTGRFF
ncbi:MAG: hypothetical protein ACYDIE_01555 [Candidatus Krumholzibacteriia bacterium]